VKFLLPVTFKIQNEMFTSKWAYIAKLFRLNFAT